MNELTYVMAILVKKDIITVQEARAILSESQKSIISSNLGEMITKVDKALTPKEAGAVETVDARSLMGQL